MFDTLYRKDSDGTIRYWKINVPAVPFTGKGNGTVTIETGCLGGKPTITNVTTHRNPKDEAESRYRIKLKQGYKSLADVKDNTPLPVKGTELISYLQAYLPTNRTTADGSLLPMLAKVYDNTNNKLYKGTDYFGQWKINGLRCFIRAIYNENNLFEPIKFTFQSREGTYWTSLDNLNDYLRCIIPESFIRQMIEENIILDGELYIPSFSINMLNHIIKDRTSVYNKFVQFWCYDIYIADTPQYERIYQLTTIFDEYVLDNIKTLDDHYNIKSLFNVLPCVDIYSDSEAEKYRDTFIDLGFEGLIMRDISLEYEAGKRKMIKYKRHTDGVFKVIDIIPEGIKRPDIAKFICLNDINDTTFECKLSAPIDVQKECLRSKDKYINKTLFIEYGERSGVNQVPFHIKKVRFNE